MKKYDALIILSNTLTDESLGKALQRIEDEIVKLGGVVDGTVKMGKRFFARSMKNQDSGIYVKMAVSLAPDAITPLLQRLKLNEDIFRVQITSKIAQNPVVEEKGEEEAVNGESE